MRAVLLTEKDPGEPSLADFWSGYVLTSKLPGTDRLLLGDFRPGFGQGLLFSRQDRAASSLSFARPRQTGRIGYRSSVENGGLRGLFAEGRADRFTWILIGSRTAWDAAVDPTPAASIRKGGQHVTKTERVRKDALKERLTAVRLAWERPRVRIGATAMRTVFNPPLDRRPSPVTTDRLASIDWDLRLPRLTLFGEAARSGRADPAWVAGAITRFKDLRLTALARRYGPRFHSLRGTAFSAYSDRPQNEWGLFLGLAWQPAPSTRIRASLDRHGRLLPAGPLSPPGRGERALFTLSHRPARSLVHDFTLGSVRKTARTADRIGPRIRQRIRTRLTFRQGALRIGGWLEGVRTRSPSGPASGRALGASLRIGRTPGSTLSAWGALFNVTACDARIYTFDPAVWSGSRLQVLAGQGQTGGLRLVFKGRPARLALRWSFKRTEIGMASSWGLQVELGTR